MHGGDIYGRKVKHDFSINVNPLGIPYNVKRCMMKAVKKASVYPDLESRELTKSLCSHFSEHSITKENIVFGNGASELIPAISEALKVKKILLVSPCFTGYEKVSSKGIEIQRYFLKAEKDFCLRSKDCEEIENLLRQSDLDFMIMTSPNNPNGSLVKKEYTERLAKAAALSGKHILIDECFVNLTDKGEENTVLNLCRKYNSLIILRAFTKTFAIPGLRLGYAVCMDKSVIQNIKAVLPEWNISVIAQKAGAACLKEKSYLSKARRIIHRERDFLMDNLKAFGFKVFESDTDFILFYDYKGQERNLRDLLSEKGILIRDCSDYPGLEKGYFRIAVKKHGENKTLVSILRKICHE